MSRYVARKTNTKITHFKYALKGDVERLSSQEVTQCHNLQNEIDELIKERKSSAQPSQTEEEGYSEDNKNETQQVELLNQHGTFPPPQSNADSEVGSKRKREESGNESKVKLSKTEAR